ncbi:MAG: ribosomal L7Ae/L30e/S12e/Gadd45 family protein [Clostridia bacterium]|nr:ribosomal L7Ae/L30e/S12e/Gadd45 family protein [Clostridia bacterium]
MNRALGSLGLAMRAGRVESGAETCDKLIKAGAAYLILIDAGASPASQKALTDACAYHSVPYRLIPAGELGRAIGKSGRMAAAITDRAFAARLRALLEDAAKQSID